MWSRRSVLTALCGGASAQSREYPDIRSVRADLEVPLTESGEARAGRRVRQTVSRWERTEVHHALYLPTDWQRGRRYPVIVEYAGNGHYRNRFGDRSDGIVEGSNLGYGLSGGHGFLWLCLPFVNPGEKRNEIVWWGDAAATVEYCEDAVRLVCERWGGDRDRLVLAGFSRGAIACNYIGLREDRIAELWRAFLPYSHYDGVRTTWPYSDCDRTSALERLRRLRGRPQFLVQENSIEETRAYLMATGVVAPFTFRTLPFRNHNDAWALRDIPVRREAREWLKIVLSA